MKYNIKCPAVQAAYVDSRNPNTHYSGADQIVISEYCTSIIKFDLSPLNSYRKKNITSIEFHGYNTKSNVFVSLPIFLFSVPINYNSITYNTLPSLLQTYEEFYPQDESLTSDEDYIKRGNVSFYYDEHNYSEFLNSIKEGIALSVARDSITFNGINSQNLYLIVNFEDFDRFVVSPDNPSNNIFINPILDNKFSVYLDDPNSAGEFNYNFLDPVAVQSASFTMQNLTDSSSQTIQIPIQNQFLTWADKSWFAPRVTIDFSVPKNTFAGNKNYKWTASITTEIGIIPSNGDTGEFNTIDATPSAPRIISPQSQYLDGEQPIILQWQHNISTGSTQYAYDIDYLQTGSWTNLVNHAVSSVQTYTIPANTLVAGNFQWRVRTYNTSNVAGPYATSERNIVEVPPQPPVIRSINAVPRLSVSWQATGQEAFNVTITDTSGNTVLNSGNVYGVQKEYEIGTYLPDGGYIVSLKIQNAQGEWSNAVTSGVNIQNNPVGVDEIQATPIRNGVSLRTGPPPADYGAYVGETVLQSPGKYLTDKIGTTETTPEGTHYILRDGEPIAKLDGNSFIDYTSVGPHEYRLRVTYADGTYYDSLPVTAAPILPYATIAFLDDPGTLFVLKYQRDARPTTEKQISETLVSHAFLGRDLPVYDATGQKSIQWDFAYTLLHNLDGAAPFFAQQKTVIVRDPKGERAIGLIQSHNLTFRRQFRELTFSVAGNDATEVIPYD